MFSRPGISSSAPRPGGGDRRPRGGHRGGQQGEAERHGAPRDDAERLCGDPEGSGSEGSPNGGFMGKS